MGLSSIMYVVPSQSNGEESYACYWRWSPFGRLLTAHDLRTYVSLSFSLVLFSPMHLTITLACFSSSDTRDVAFTRAVGGFAPPPQDKFFNRDSQSQPFNECRADRGSFFCSSYRINILVASSRSCGVNNISRMDTSNNFERRPRTEYLAFMRKKPKTSPLVAVTPGVD